MWFKQAHVLQINAKIPYSREDLTERLEKMAYTPCLPTLPATQGWIAPNDQNESEFVYKSSDRPRRGLLRIRNSRFERQWLNYL